MIFEKLFKKRTEKHPFWNWFTQNADIYFYFERNQDALFSKLKTELKKIHPDIVFEFSTILEDGTREFIISADGIKSIFPIVKDLVLQAPTLKNWKIIAFRQPKKNVITINYQNLSINLDGVFFRYSKDSGYIGLELNIRDFYESAEWSAAVFILLDYVLGEYETEMSLSYIEKKPLNENEIDELFPITTLPDIVQSYKSEFNN